jgi:ATP-dependent protease HslVU (ClpYQ) peptidase subunit
MSLVIAIKEKDRIVLGADKQVSLGSTKGHTSTKIWKVDELPGALMGGVGSARATQIIQYSQIIDKNFTGPINTEFVICVLIPTITAALKANGIVISSKEDDCILTPNVFIFAYLDKAWVIWHDLSVVEITDYFAIGSGADVARGALFATKEKNSFERIVTCIDAATESTLFVDDGIDLLTTYDKPKDPKQVAKALGLDLSILKELNEETSKN